MICSEKIPKKMHALVLHDIGKLTYEEINNYELKPETVLVKIEYCSICSSDIERVFKTGTYHYPTIPGHEMAGKIVAVNDVNKDLLEKKAAIFPMLPCMKCEPCLNQEYAQCDNYNYFGSRCDGGFAEYLLVPIWNLILLPAKLSCKIAALCEPSAVALHATNILKLKKGEKLAISGSGTIGLLIALFAKEQGAKVTIVGRNQNKLEIAKKLGYEILHTNSIPDNLNKYDKVIEAVGSNESINQAFKLVKTLGKIVLVGNPKENVLLDKNNYWKILRKQLIVTGSWNSSYSEKQNDWKEVLKYMNKNPKYFESLITKEFLLEDNMKAFEYLIDKTKIKSKVVYKIGK